MSRDGSPGLAGLPAHYRREHQTLLEAGVNSWEQLAALSGETLRVLAAAGVASEARLLRLRSQARLMEGAGLAPHEAAVLMHAGIAEVRALAEADPQRLQVLVNRLCTRLLGPAHPSPPLSTVRRWIRDAAASRSAN